jgi:probable DNA repair protein
VQLAHAAAQLAGGLRVWASPDVLTPSAWARRECERYAEQAPQEWPRILGATEEWLLWRQAAQHAAHGFPFLEIGALAESLQRASARAAEYGVRLTAGAPGSEAALLDEARRLFEARCRELNAATVSSLLPRLERSSGHAPLLRGFAAVPPRLAALATMRAGTSGDAPVGSRAAPRAVRTPDAPSQMEAIAAWCLERLRAQSDARLLVMLPGPAGPRERLAALIGASLDPRAALAGGAARSLVAIEGDAPLGSLPLPAQALLSLSILAGAEIDVESASAWLTAPCWETPGPAARAALALHVRQRVAATVNLRALLGALQLAPQTLQPAARELDARLRQGAGRLTDGRASPRRWSERIDAALASLGWPGSLAPESAALHQTRLRWRELLEEFGELDASTGALAREAALELLRALALRTVHGRADEDVPVTLSPVLVDPVVIYDGIWVGSLSADVLPQPVSPNPFLPLRTQIEAGVPEASAAGRRAQGHSLLAAWQVGARELVLSVPEREEDLELLPSPYVRGWRVEEKAGPSLWLPRLLHQDGCLESVEDVRGTAFNSLTPLPSGTRALTLQNACPFRAYAELRLGATPPEEAEPGVAMDQRGLLLHAALQMLWERLQDSRSLGALEAPALEALIADCVARSAQILQGEGRGRRRRRVPDGQLDLFARLSPALERECVRARTLIRRLCELERTRAPFTVEATEHVTELALGGGRIRMRLDRVDRMAAGRAVLDYKSGRPGSPDWFGERPTHPQLLAYLAALGTDVVALATVNLTAREVRFAGVAAAGNLLPRVRPLPPGAGAAAATWSAQQSSWTALIERLIRAFLAGEAHVDPAPGACDFCHVTDICRIGAHVAPEPAPQWDDADE